MSRTHNKGLTLIEVLLVITIIGIISTFVLVGVMLSRGRANDSNIKTSIVQARWLAEMVYDVQGASYEQWSEHELVQDQLDLLLKEVNLQHNQSEASPYIMVINDNQRHDYCISAPLFTDNAQHYCTDASGNTITVNNPCPEAGEEDEEEPLRCVDLL